MDWQTSIYFCVPRRSEGVRGPALSELDHICARYLSERSESSPGDWIPATNYNRLDELESRGAIERHDHMLRPLGLDDLTIVALPRLRAPEDESDFDGRDTPSLEPVMRHIHESLQRLTLPSTWSPEDVSDNPHLVALAQRCARRLTHSAFNVHRGANVRRVYHSLCVGGSRDLRKAVRLNGSPLVDLDFKSAHPTMLATWCKDDAERTTYQAALAGDFYKLLAPDTPRPIAKAHYGVLVAGRYFPNIPLHKGFHQRWPNLGNHILALGGLHAELQNLEADIVVGEVGDWCRRHGKFFVPIHDGALVSPEDAHEIAAQMQQAWNEHVPIATEVTADGITSPAGTLHFVRSRLKSNGPFNLWYGTNTALMSNARLALDPARDLDTAARTPPTWDNICFMNPPRHWRILCN